MRGWGGDGGFLEGRGDPRFCLFEFFVIPKEIPKKKNKFSLFSLKTRQNQKNRQKLCIILKKKLLFC